MHTPRPFSASPEGNTVPRHSNRDAKKARGEARHGKTRPRRTRSEPPVHQIKTAYATVSSFLAWNSLLVPAVAGTAPDAMTFVISIQIRPQRNRAGCCFDERTSKR
jgi:hypothetical protein